MKRALDALISSLLLIGSAVVFLPVALALRLTGDREVFFLQLRAGRHKQIFNVIKFTTILKPQTTEQENLPVLPGDPRITSLGRLLRVTKINELPQLVNVLRGEMSLVGWRPLLPEVFAAYPESIQTKIASVRPGLTGIASIVFRNEELLIDQLVAAGADPVDAYRREILPYKGALEAWYADHVSLAIDIRIVLATMIAVVLPRWDGYWGWFPDLPAPKSPAVRRFLQRGNPELSWDT